MCTAPVLRDNFLADGNGAVNEKARPIIFPCAGKSPRVRADYLYIFFRQRIPQAKYYIYVTDLGTAMFFRARKHFGRARDSVENASRTFSPIPFRVRSRSPFPRVRPLVSMSNAYKRAALSAAHRCELCGDASAFAPGGVNISLFAHPQTRVLSLSRACTLFPRKLRGIPTVEMRRL